MNRIDLVLSAITSEIDQCQKVLHESENGLGNLRHNEPGRIYYHRRIVESLRKIARLQKELDQWSAIKKEV